MLKQCLILNKFSINLSYSSVMTTSTIVTWLPVSGLAPQKSILPPAARVVFRRCKCRVLPTLLLVKYVLLTLLTRPFLASHLPLPHSLQGLSLANAIIIFCFFSFLSIFICLFVQCCIASCLHDFPRAASPERPKPYLTLLPR